MGFIAVGLTMEQVGGILWAIHELERGARSIRGLVETHGQAIADVEDETPVSVIAAEDADPGRLRTVEAVSRPPPASPPCHAGG